MNKLTIAVGQIHVHDGWHYKILILEDSKQCACVAQWFRASTAPAGNFYHQDRRVSPGIEGLNPY